jgi:hypothetical protein
MTVRRVVTGYEVVKVRARLLIFRSDRTCCKKVELLVSCGTVCALALVLDVPAVGRRLETAGGWLLSRMPSPSRQTGNLIIPID